MRKRREPIDELINAHVWLRLKRNRRLDRQAEAFLAQVVGLVRLAQHREFLAASLAPVRPRLSWLA